MGKEAQSILCHYLKISKSFLETVTYTPPLQNSKLFFFFFYSVHSPFARDKDRTILQKPRIKQKLRTSKLKDR